MLLDSFVFIMIYSNPTTFCSLVSFIASCSLHFVLVAERVKLMLPTNRNLYSFFGIRLKRPDGPKLAFLNDVIFVIYCEPGFCSVGAVVFTGRAGDYFRSHLRYALCSSVFALLYCSFFMFSRSFLI